MITSNNSRAKIILIVDDDEDDRALFRDALKEVDDSIKCLSAVDGEDALKQLGKRTDLPDYIFLDLNMPRLNGIQCLASIRKDKKLNNIHVIIYSTSQRPEDISEAKKLGASLFVTKPALFKKICKTISSVLAMDDSQFAFSA